MSAKHDVVHDLKRAVHAFYRRTGGGDAHQSEEVERVLKDADGALTPEEVRDAIASAILAHTC